MSHGGRSGKGNGSRGKGRGGGHGKGRQGTGRARSARHGIRHGVGPEDAPFPVRTSQSRPRPENPGQSSSSAIEYGIEDLKQKADSQGLQIKFATDPAQVVSGNLCKQIPEHKKVTAVIDQENCDGCGTCIDICPMGAITAAELTVIDTQECAGCGMCVEGCPNNAIYFATMKIAQ